MLNISHNSISNLSGLQHCTALSTLICSRNSLTGYDSINALSYCKALSTIDLQDNRLDANAVRLTCTMLQTGLPEKYSSGRLPTMMPSDTLQGVEITYMYTWTWLRVWPLASYTKGIQHAVMQV